MKAYVIGAGVSHTAGYPLGGALFDEINRFVQGTGGDWRHGDDYSKWQEMLNWLMTDDNNPLIAEAARTGRIEHLFTILDLSKRFAVETLVDCWRAYNENDEERGAKAEAARTEFKAATSRYEECHGMLLHALESYFNYRHYLDAGEGQSARWETLERFGRILQEGDMVITFNYDSTLERVLLRQGKWSPRNGYGFDLVFQKSQVDETPLVVDSSSITVLHLHGAIGWYNKPVFRVDPKPGSGGAVSRDAFTPAPLETHVSLDNQFLCLLGFQGADASLPVPRYEENQILLRPSFLKDYEMNGAYQNPFPGLWRKAAEGLRRADEVLVIGYSLPPDDIAALTLFLASCDKDKVRIINPSVSDSSRLRNLLSMELHFEQPLSFDDWLASASDHTDQR